MRILIIGGTKFIGAAVARRLHEDGHTVAVFNRGQTAHTLPDAITQTGGDVQHLAAARAAFIAFAPEVVLHNIVVTEQDAINAVDVFTGVARRWVMTSSMDVYQHYGRLLGMEPGERLPIPADEDAPLRTVWYPRRSQTDDPADRLYNYDKIPAERVALNTPDLPGTVLRLPMVIGAGDPQGRLHGFVRPMHTGAATLTLSQEYAGWASTYDYVENVAAAMALAVTDDRAIGRVYNVGDHPKTGLELARAVQAALGWSGEIVTRPNAELPEDERFGAADLQPLVCSAARIRAELGYQPPFTFAEGIRRTAVWDAEHLSASA